MRLKLLPGLAILLLLSSCGGNKRPNTDVDVAKTFVTEILNNRFEKASELMLVDPQNQDYFDLFKKDYHNKSAEELDKYRKAEFVIRNLEPVNDSISIITFSNTYLPDKTNKLKLLKRNNLWYIDLKYTFSGNL